MRISGTGVSGNISLGASSPKATPTRHAAAAPGGHLVAVGGGGGNISLVNSLSLLARRGNTRATAAAPVEYHRNLGIVAASGSGNVALGHGARVTPRYESGGSGPGGQGYDPGGQGNPIGNGGGFTSLGTPAAHFGAGTHHDTGGFGGGGHGGGGGAGDYAGIRPFPGDTGDEAYTGPADPPSTPFSFGAGVMPGGGPGGTISYDLVNGYNSGGGGDINLLGGQM